MRVYVYCAREDTAQLAACVPGWLRAACSRVILRLPCCVRDCAMLVTGYWSHALHGARLYLATLSYAGPLLSAWCNGIRFLPA